MWKSGRVCLNRKLEFPDHFISLRRLYSRLMRNKWDRTLQVLNILSVIYLLGLRG